MAACGRRGSEAWGRPAGTTAPAVEVLIPTYQRPAELAVTLSGLAAQDDPAFAVVISDDEHPHEIVGDEEGTCCNVASPCRRIHFEHTLHIFT